MLNFHDPNILTYFPARQPPPKLGVRLVSLQDFYHFCLGASLLALDRLVSPLGLYHFLPRSLSVRVRLLADCLQTFSSNFQVLKLCLRTLS